jgi:hypothetical protein
MRLMPLAPVLGRCLLCWCGEIAELEDREPIVNTLPHHKWHPKRIHEKELFWLEEGRKTVRRYDTTRR